MPDESVGFVIRSPNRTDVLKFFADYGPAKPSEIAERTGISLSHVSRTLTELGDRGLIMLMVPEDQQKNRLYDITETGVEVLDVIRTHDEVGGYQVVSPSEFRYQTLLSFLRESVDASVLGVADQHGRELELCFPEEEMRKGLRERELLEEVVTDLTVASRASDADFASFERIDYTWTKLIGPKIPGYEEAQLHVLHPCADITVTIMLERTEDLIFPSFAERCLDKLHAR